MTGVRNLIGVIESNPRDVDSAWGDGGTQRELTKPEREFGKGLEASGGVNRRIASSCKCSVTVCKQ
jgi:hypothetical protein